jgi:hypothetical protein
MFTFDGGCFESCPEKTYIVPEKPAEGGGYRSKGLSLKRRDANSDEFGNLHDIIGNTESLVKNREITSQKKLCASCHFSCASCHGALESECMDCASDYNRIVIGSSVQCVRPLKNNTSEHFNRPENYSALKIILIILLITVLLSVTCISFYVICRKTGFDNAPSDSKSFSGVSYNKIRQDNEDVLVVQLPNIDDDSDGSEI